MLYSITCALLNHELPANSRGHIIEQFNRGLFDYLIATDQGIEYQDDSSNSDPSPSKPSGEKKEKEAESEESENEDTSGDEEEKESEGSESSSDEDDEGIITLITL